MIALADLSVSPRNVRREFESLRPKRAALFMSPLSRQASVRWAAAGVNGYVSSERSSGRQTTEDRQWAKRFGAGGSDPLRAQSGDLGLPVLADIDNCNRHAGSGQPSRTCGKVVTTQSTAHLWSP